MEFIENTPTYKYALHAIWFAHTIGNFPQNGSFSWHLVQICSGNISERRSRKAFPFKKSEDAQSEGNHLELSAAKNTKNFRTLKGKGSKISHSP